MKTPNEIHALEPGARGTARLIRPIHLVPGESIALSRSRIVKTSTSPVKLA